MLTFLPRCSPIPEMTTPISSRRSSKVEQCHIQTVISSKLRMLCFNQNRAKCPSRYPFLSVWSRAILSDRSFLSLDDVRIQPREAPFDLTMKVGVE